ncbi:hypothetical protein [Floridanema aerugineum]|uniref:Uncharacterized protein n=1 Tax=Floridaenema aerugineum BLCC-F46 TaxID=3153654 RepID=A0ABV4X431_9CYAN
MGEAKRRKNKDPNYGKPKAYMSYYEMPHTNKLVTGGELKRMIRSLKEWAKTHEFYATVVFEHTRRWQKIEKLCFFIGMEKILNHNNKLYNTCSVFVTKSLSENDRNRLIKFYTTSNLEGEPAPPPPLTWQTTKKALDYSQGVYDELLKDSDVDCIHLSDNCAAFYVPSDTELEGLYYVDFYTKLLLQSH